MCGSLLHCLYFFDTARYNHESLDLAGNHALRQEPPGRATQVSNNRTAGKPAVAPGELVRTDEACACIRTQPKAAETTAWRFITMTMTIHQDKAVRSGAPCIGGTRLTIADVVYALTYGGVTFSEATSYHPALERGTIIQCLKFCSSQDCKRSELQSYCEGCTLDATPIDLGEDAPENVWELAATKLKELGDEPMNTT